ncbi:MAG: penicillin-binding protein 2, partial [Deltaproteobacteria bacterium]|nr:penicillin-binding protein 2 [Deltaproteobacteria bacterium]
MSDYFSDKEPGELKFRAQMATVAVSVIFFVLSARLWQLQVFSGDYYRGLAENNRIRTVKSPAPRGMIYDRLGVKLAENRPGFDLYLVPEDVQDWD